MNKTDLLLIEAILLVVHLPLLLQSLLSVGSHQADPAEGWQMKGAPGKFWKFTYHFMENWNTFLLSVLLSEIPKGLWTSTPNSLGLCLHWQAKYFHSRSPSPFGWMIDLAWSLVISLHTYKLWDCSKHPGIEGDAQNQERLLTWVVRLQTLYVDWYPMMVL